MVVAASLVRSEANDEIDQCAEVIGRSDHRLRLFKAIYTGQKKKRSIEDLVTATGMNEKQVRTALAVLFDHHMCKVTGRGASTIVSKDEFCRKHRDRIIRAVTDPEYRGNLEVRKARRQTRSIASLPVRAKARLSRSKSNSKRKLGVVCLATNPHGDLRTDVEVRVITSVHKKSGNRDRIVLENLAAATMSDLLDSLNEFRPEVVHFSGHGNEGSILLDDEDGGSGTQISFDLLKRALEATDNPPQLLVLNSCLGAVSAQELLGNVACVVAMNDSIDDAAAAAFSRQFYSAIFGGQSVESAVEQARVAMTALGLDDADLPELVGAKPEAGKLILI